MPLDALRGWRERADAFIRHNLVEGSGAADCSNRYSPPTTQWLVKEEADRYYTSKRSGLVGIDRH